LAVVERVSNANCRREIGVFISENIPLEREEKEEKEERERKGPKGQNRQCEVMSLTNQDKIIVNRIYLPVKLFS
jgi:hypothetical protein